MPIPLEVFLNDVGDERPVAALGLELHYAYITE